MTNTQKYILIALSILLIVIVVLYLFRKKIFNNEVAVGVETDNIKTVLNKPFETVSATANNGSSTGLLPTFNELNINDKVYSNANQTIQRVEIIGNRFVYTGTASVSNGFYVGTVKQITPNGYYVTAKKGLAAQYYWLGKTQVK